MNRGDHKQTKKIPKIFQNCMVVTLYSRNSQLPTFKKMFSYIL